MCDCGISCSCSLLFFDLPQVITAAVRSKVVILLSLLFIHCLLLLPLCGGLCWSLLCGVVFIVLFSFVIILLRRRELIAYFIVFWLSCGWTCSVFLPGGDEG